MKERIRKWTNNHTFGTLLIFVTILALASCITYYRVTLGWTSWEEWTGFGSTTKLLTTKIDSTTNETITKEISPTKTLWDFLGIILGVLAAILIAILNESNQTRRKQTELDIAKKRTQEDRNIVADQQRENYLRIYLDDIAKLIIDHNLINKIDKEDSPTRKVAQIKTITALRALDKDRRNIILQFLRDSGLGDFILIKASMRKLDLWEGRLYKLNLSGANLDHANLSGAFLWEANLSGADIRYANLSGAHLYKADLSGAHLKEANLSGASLYKVNLSGAHLWKTNLSGASLSKANMSGASLMNANLNGAHLYKANLSGAKLLKANLSGAELTEANLSMAEMYFTEPDGSISSKADLTGADLSKANLTSNLVLPEQLSQVKSLKGATMPNGNVHE